MATNYGCKKQMKSLIYPHNHNLCTFYWKYTYSYTLVYTSPTKTLLKCFKTHNSHLHKNTNLLKNNKILNFYIFNISNIFILNSVHFSTNFLKPITHNLLSIYKSTCCTNLTYLLPSVFDSVWFIQKQLNA